MITKVLLKFRDKVSNESFAPGDTYKSEDIVRVGDLVKMGYLQDPEEVEIFPQHTGNGWYVLSNGEKVKGKQQANSAESKLQRKSE